MNPNQRFAALVGIKWHEKEHAQMGYTLCSCGAEFNGGLDLVNHIHKSNPDFADALLLALAAQWGVKVEVGG